MTPLFVCLDVQRVFVEPGPLYAPQAGQALLHGRRLLRLARDRRWQVAHCMLRHDAAPLRLSLDDARPVEGFEPTTRERVFERRELSAYAHPAFDQLASKCQRTGLVFIGLSASLTLLATLFDAFDRGHHGIVAVDALAAQRGDSADVDRHAAVSKDIASLLGFTLRSMSDTDAAVSALHAIGFQGGGSQ